MSNAISKIVRPTSTLKAPWGWVLALFGTVASFYGAQTVAQFIFGVYIGFQGWNDAKVTEWIASVPFQFVYTLIVEALTLGIIWLFVHRYGWQKIREGLGLTKPRLSAFGIMLLAFVGYYLLYFALLAVTSSFLPIDTNQEQDIGFEHASRSGLFLAMTFVSLVVLPPLVEEIVFRGYLFGGLRKHFSPIIAAIITSILFAIPHSWQSTDGSTLWNAAIDTFALSLVLCYLREKTGSIWAGIGVHALKNLVAFLAIFIFHVQ